MRTDAGSASTAWMSTGRVDGDGMEVGSGVGAWAVSGDQWELMVISFTMSVISLMITHYLAD